MTEPAKPALTEGKVHGGKISKSQHFLVDDLLLPCNSKDATNALWVKGINFLLLHPRQRPYFTNV